MVKLKLISEERLADLLVKEYFLQRLEECGISEVTSIYEEAWSGPENMDELEDYPLTAEEYSNLSNEDITEDFKDA